MSLPAANPAITFATIFHDEHLLIVNKRAGLVTQPGRGHEDDALLNGLMAHHTQALARLGSRRDYGLVHRLDRQTSGLLVVALTTKAHDHLRAQFEAHTVKKFYWAVCSKPPKLEAGLIDKPLLETTPKDFSEKKLAKVSPRGKPAQSAYRTLAVSEHAALIEVRPLTGRLHQVRVHLESIGCPILGDDFYASDSLQSAAPRLALHAHRLIIDHPATGEPLDTHSKWPDDLRALLKRLKLPKPAV